MDPAPNPREQERQLEDLGLMFLDKGAYPASATLFIRLLKRRPKHANAWYGLGNSFLMIAGTSKDRETLRQALSCLHKAVKLNRAHPLAKKLIDFIRSSTPLSSEDFRSCRAFSGEPESLMAVVGIDEQTLVTAVAALESWNERMQVVMGLGDQGEAFYVPLLTAAAEDSNSHVQMAALKRLNPWAESPGVEACFSSLVDSGRWKSLEPYVSLALESMDTDWARELAAQLVG